MLALLLLCLSSNAAAQPSEPAARTPGPDAPVEVVAPDEPNPTPEPAPIVAPTQIAKPEPVAPAPLPIATVVAEAQDPNDITKSRYVPGKGIEWTSRDGKFAVQLRARMHIRYDLEHPNVEGGNTQQSLQIRRARVQLQGHLFGKHNRYVLQLGFAPRDQINALVAPEGSIRRSPLRDARLEFDYLRDFTIWVGQFKVPFSRQNMQSSSNMNMVDRSVPHDEFHLDRDLGIQAMSKDVGGMGWLGYHAGVFMGEGRNAFELAKPGMLYVGRVVVSPLGEFEGDDTESDLARLKKPGIAIAGAYAYHDRAPGDRGTQGSMPVDGGTTDFHNATADLLFKWHGVSWQSAFHWRRGFNRVNGGAVDADDLPIATAVPRNGLGWFGQVGWLVPKIPFEVVARYGFTRVRGSADSAMPWREEAGGGFNYYFAGHNLKLQIDYFRLYGKDTGVGFVDAARHGTDRVRLQMQLAF